VKWSWNDGKDGDDVTSMEEVMVTIVN